MEEMNDLNGTGERRLYPRLEINRQVELKELAQRISEGTTFTPGDILGVVGALSVRIAQLLAEGCSVKLNGLGNFTASLKLRKGLIPEQAEGGGNRHNARSIEIGSVHFKPEKDFIGEINGNFRPERSERKSRRSSAAYSPQQRLNLALGFLATVSYLTVGDYCRLTGLLHTAASKELRLWATTEGSGIKASGSGSHRVYVREMKSEG